MKSEKELRELDAWIAEHVMGLVLCKRRPAILNPNEFVLSIPSKIVRARIGTGPTINFQPTIDPAAAMLVLKHCIKSEKGNLGLSMRGSGEGFGIVAKHDVYELTLELAICLFAQKLFTPNPES